MRRSDEFVTWLASDTDCSFSEWLQRREAAARRRHTPEPPMVMPLGLTYALGIVLCCVVLTVVVLTKAVGLW